MVIEKLESIYGRGSRPLQLVFISIDPARDTMAQTHSYCAEFGPNLLALTGTTMQIKRITRLFRVYYNEGIRSDDSEDYLVDHSVIHYLMDRQGNFVEFFGKNMTADEMAQRIAQIIDLDQKLEKRDALLNA